MKTEDFYRRIGDTLKNNYPNTFAWFITSDLESAKDTGLWYTEKIKLYNGKIETEFVKYEIYDKAKEDEGN